METVHSDQTYLKHLGKQIRKIREDKGWSQEHLAFLCGLHRTYVGAVERGERNVTVLNLKKIANALEIPVAYILPFEGK